MAVLNPYLNFNGTAEEAFTFYKSVFGGEFTTMQRFKDTPQAGKVSPEEGEKLMHIALPIGNGNTIMATDAIASMGHTMKEGTNFHLSLATDSEEETERLFNGLSAGGKITVPLAKAFWGAYFGMFTDTFGIQWMVNYDSSQAK